MGLAAWPGLAVEDTILELRAQGQNGGFVQAIGLLCDQVEVLYDIDTGFRRFAQKHSMRPGRAESLNESLIAALAAMAGARAYLKIASAPEERESCVKGQPLRARGCFL